LARVCHKFHTVTFCTMAQSCEASLLSSCGSVCLQDREQYNIEYAANLCKYEPAVFSTMPPLSSMTGFVLVQEKRKPFEQKSNKRTLAKKQMSVSMDGILSSESTRSTSAESFSSEESEFDATSKVSSKSICKMVSDVRAELSILKLGPHETDNRVLKPLSLNVPEVASPGRICVFDLDDTVADADVTGVPCERAAFDESPSDETPSDETQPLQELNEMGDRLKNNSVALALAQLEAAQRALAENAAVLASLQAQLVAGGGCHDTTSDNVELFDADLEDFSKDASSQGSRSADECTMLSI